MANNNQNKEYRKQETKPADLNQIKTQAPPRLDSQANLRGENTEKKENQNRIEPRIMSVVDAELRVDDKENPKIIGYATKYGNFYPVFDFDERIVAGAFDEVLANDDTDVIASFNHNVDHAFARQSAGTLRLKSNSVGLMYEADITDGDGRMVREKILAGTIKGSSFMFSDVDDDWTFKDGERPKRTIKKVRNLYELGPVVWPANMLTTVKARADEILAEARARNLEAARKEKVLDTTEQSEEKRGQDALDTTEQSGKKRGQDALDTTEQSEEKRGQDALDTTEQSEEKRGQDALDTDGSQPDIKYISDEDMRKKRAGYRIAGQVIGRMNQKKEQAEA